MIRERLLTTGRGPIACLESGSGWPLILLHAFPLSAEMWRLQLEAAPEGWRFIAPDLRGFGRSLPPAAAMTIDDYAVDAAELMNSLEIEDAVIVGLSMGGYAALALYRTDPARFTGLVLANTRAAADTEEGRAGRVRMRELVASGGSAALAEQMLPRLLSPSAVGTATGARVRELIERSEPAAIDAALTAMMNRPDSSALLPQISCPVLVLASDGDQIVSVAEAESMQRAIPRAALAVIPEAGHLSNLEQPQRFSRALANFLLAHL